MIILTLTLLTIFAIAVLPFWAKDKAGVMICLLQIIAVAGVLVLGMIADVWQII